MAPAAGSPSLPPEPVARPAKASITDRPPHARARLTGTPDLAPAERLLKRVFGHDAFRPFQVDLISHVLQHRDALGIIPTGGGKSLCYQLPALLFDGLTVVVSPLIALMQDQVDQLRELGVPAVFLNSTLSAQEYIATTARLRRGEVRLLYTSPETLLRPETLVLLDACRVACFTIDEAHCISSWGHDFRPEYRQLLPVRQRYAQAVCLALTATAAPRVQHDIMDILGFTEDNTVIASFDRPNLFLAAQPRTDSLAQTVAFLRQHRDQSGIIYCSTRRQVDELAAKLSAYKFAVLPYHAGMDDAARRTNQQRFVRDEVPVMVATVAFGMGINKSNVRFILHHNLPQNLESYYQQVGRAGRDGLPSDCLLLYGSQDIGTIWRFIEDGAESQRAGAQARLQAMVRFAESGACRRGPLLRYFGEEPVAETCTMCDNCRRGADNRPRSDVTEAARQFLTVVQQTGQVFGALHVINVLRGSRSQDIQRRKHDRLPLYGQGREYSTEVWRRLAQQFITQGLLEQDMRIGSLRLTEAGREVLSGGQVLAHLDAGVLSAAAAVTQETGEYDEGLFQTLRGLRQRLAAAAGVPPYVVFSDRSLVEMATYFPHTPSDLLAVEGVGDVKLERYGEAFLNVIRPYCAAHGLQPRARASVTPRAGAVSRTGLRRFEEVGGLFAGGRSVAELQALYGVTRGTIIEHLTAYVHAGHTIDGTRLQGVSNLSPARQAEVLSTIAEHGPDTLRPVFDALAGTVPWDELRLLRLIYLTGAADASSI
jgi:ATP-dependent DNA helicase RecQ